MDGNRTIMNNQKWIGPIKDGVRKDVKPFAIPEDAFEDLTNAYQFRGRIVRRPGYTLLGRLANNTSVMGLRTQELFVLNDQALIAFDTTNAYKYDTGTMAFISLPTVMPTVWNGTDSQFFWTINYAGAFWATNNNPGLNGFVLDPTGTFTAQTGTGLTAKVNVLLNSVPANNFQLGDQVYFLNVTGAAAANNLAYGVVSAINVGSNPNEITVTSLIPNTATFTFAFVNGDVSTGMVLSSTRQAAGQDGIRYYGELTDGAGWANYNPPLTPNVALAGCLLMFSYRGYLVFLNTWEGNDTAAPYNYGNRARWTQLGTPYYSQPVPQTPNIQGVDPQAVRSDIFGKGGFQDAATQEVIVSAGFIRDILVVEFERSTWRLRFVNNTQTPFVWERINVDLGSDCTFSGVTFDKGFMSISNRGITISDANDVVRFDDKIPDEIFAIRQANSGLKRVYGIRTFRTRLVYWTYPDSDNPSGIYPDKVLVYNYDTRNWSFFDDCFTCFGYYYPSTTGVTWQQLTDPWQSYSQQTAEDGITIEQYETIIAGNQQGFVFQLEQTSAQNDPSLYISALSAGQVTSPNNNLPDGSWVKLSGVTGTTSSDGVSLNSRNFKIAVLDANDFLLTEFASILGNTAVGSSYTYTVDYLPILPGSVQINIGTLQFNDTILNGVLNGTGGSGTIDYNTGLIVLGFTVPIGSPTNVYIRVVSQDPTQLIVPVSTTGAYGGGGLIAKISNFEIDSKFFNFLPQDRRTRLSRIDFYTNQTSNGQFTCNILGDSTATVLNTPLSDNPQSNVVLTTQTPYQVGVGEQTIYRLYCDAIAQTLQVQLTLSDAQMATDSINTEDVELLGMMFQIRDGGRLV
jgi:hypothetical protein